MIAPPDGAVGPDRRPGSPGGRAAGQRAHPTDRTRRLRSRR